MAILYSDICSHLKKIEKELKNELRGLDEIIQEGRIQHDIPIYSTKYRIKSPESIFLKTKRKKHKINALDQITDYAGFRILCLFEKDIFIIHEYLLRALSAEGYAVKEMNIFNWESKDNKDNITLLFKITRKYFPKLTPLKESRDSGYKSVHYIIERLIGGKTYTIEIQLRTLLQDVWGELEHSLSYKKGNIHPHIKKSFNLLARDLESMDILVSHLRDISEREQCGNQYSNEKIGPRYCFSYEPELIPKLFSRNESIQKKYNAYWEHVSLVNNKVPGWLGSANNLYQELYKELSARDLKDDPAVSYFFGIEEAYLLFFAGEYVKALEIYNALKKSHPTHYVIHFRIGEINFIQGNIEKALEAFDECERLISITQKHEAVNLYKVKTRLALAYWTLGTEYIDIAVEKINEAKATYEKDINLFIPQDLEVLLNNLCWYSLEKYLKCNYEALRTEKKEDIDKAEESYSIALAYFSKLEKMLTEENTNSNTFDTVAMFCFHTFKRTKDPTYLSRAKQYCKMMGDRVKYTSFNYRSMNIQLNHIQEIMHSDED